MRHHSKITISSLVPFHVPVISPLLQGVISMVSSDLNDEENILAFAQNDTTVRFPPASVS